MWFDAFDDRSGSAAIVNKWPMTGVTVKYMLPGMHEAECLAKDVCHQPVMNLFLVQRNQIIYRSYG